MSYQNILLARSVADERERDLRRDLARRRPGTTSGRTDRTLSAGLAQRWHDALVHLHLAPHAR